MLAPLSGKGSISIDTRCSTRVNLHDSSHTYSDLALVSLQDTPYTNLIKDFLNISTLRLKRPVINFPGV